MSNESFEGFNVVEAADAFSEAIEEIDELIDKQESQSELVFDQFGGQADTTKALGGNLGQYGANAYTNAVDFSYSELKTRLHSFMNVGLKNIIENNANLIEESAVVYANNDNKTT